jgi:hypothetical protein
MNSSRRGHFNTHAAIEPALTVLVIEIIGWLAAALILASYVLLSLGKLEARGAVYQWMNVIGAGGFVLNSGYNGAMPSAGLNIVWAMMGLYTLWSVARARRQAHGPAGDEGYQSPRR